ncbi:hypothetical protein BASA50_001979 [Batrachochytrium salamandrivorans]|uniref:Uncharacterized protein n=1 Tax=Batrachochytrium salamandrivorans TaxID=1357716 RepID=A0ABQ8FMS4_9FUNG|nr:hypothetical protein BASA50_001979 [Batrachochytrium salamandrivorans]
MTFIVVAKHTVSFYRRIFRIRWKIEQEVNGLEWRGFPIIKQVWGVTLPLVSGFKLADHQLTVNYRSRIFSAMVMGKAYYGSELVGGNKSHLAPLQTTINKGIRLFTGARLSTAIGLPSG